MGYQPYMRDLPDTEFAARQNADPESRLSSLLKRSTDFIVAVFAMLFFLPVMAVIAILIKTTDGGPIIFRHTRIGRNGKEFKCFKFRSMTADAEAKLPSILSKDEKARSQWRANQKIEDDPRITKFGRFLRKSSLDELPQFVNILRGEMSIVGPRPIVKKEIDKYGEFFPYYCSVRPGLTGLWQVSGRSETTYDERVQLDVKYVVEWSYLKDLQIMIMTIPAVLKSDGAV